MSKHHQMSRRISADFRFAYLVAFLIIIMLMGGASRADVPSQMGVRLAAIGLGTVGLIYLKPMELKPFSRPILFLGAIAVVMALQLVPLPPAVWTSLPGRGLFAHLAEAADLKQPWRPVSISPDFTINSLLSLTVPLAALVLFARAPREKWAILLILLAALIGISALIGLAQISGRMDALYLYRITNEGVAVGLFANRNHQAALLAMVFPILATIAVFPKDNKKRSIQREWVIVAMAMFIVPLVLVTGSRAGLVLLLAGMGGAWLLYSTGAKQVASSPELASGRRGQRHRTRKPRNYGIWIAGASLALVTGLTMILARAEAIRRIFDHGAGQERRLELFAPIARLVWKYFPVGSGFGSFDSVFRVDEPFDSLAPEYMNHAHNDLFEFLLEGGLPAALILIAFLTWFGARAGAVWRERRVQPARSEAMARLGSVLIAILLLASLVDYPLRTPIMMTLFALACAFLCLPLAGRRGARSEILSSHDPIAGSAKGT